MLIRVYRNDGTENWINPEQIAYVSPPSGRYEGTIILTCGTSIGYARPANLIDQVNSLTKDKE